MGADYRIPSIDYSHIFRVCAAITHSMARLWEVYRIMVFNFLIDNKDDHAKNSAFIHRDGGWHPAPAFDLLPSSGINGFRNTSINDSIIPSVADLIAVGAGSGLNTSEMKGIFNAMQQVVAIKEQ